MEHGENVYRFVRDEVDDPVPVAHQLADVLDIDLRNRPTQMRMCGEGLGGRVEARDNRPGILWGSALEVGTDRIKIVEGTARPPDLSHGSW